MVSKYIKRILYLSLLGLMVSCTDSKKEHSVQRPIIAYANETLNVTSLDKDSHSVQISINGKVVQNETFSEVYKSSISKIAKGYGSNNEIALLATDNLINTGIPIEVKIDDIIDTTFFAEIKPIEKSVSPSSIVGNCAKLILSISNPQQGVELKKWLIRRNEYVDNQRLEQMIGILGKLNYSGYSDYVTNDNIPVVKSFVGTSYRVQSDMTADHYVLYATSSDNEIKSFVEEVIANDYDLTVKSLAGVLNCYRKMNSDGYKCITLIGINDDWSYKVVPLGLIAIDNTAPTHSKQQPHNIVSIELKGKQRVLFPNSVPAINGFADVAVKYWNGNGVSCNVSFIVYFGGDAKSITVVRNKNLCYPYEHRVEKKQISLSGKESPYVFNYDLHFAAGDNIIPIIVEDYYGNTDEYTLTVRASFTHDPTPSTNIYNNNSINVW